MKALWQKLQAKLGSQNEGGTEPVQHAVEYAAASLLIEIGHVDMDFDPLERDAVRKAITEVFSLDQSEVCQIIERAERDHSDAVTFHPHVETINAECSQEDKAEIVEQIWRVAMADGHIDKYEEHYLRKLADLLHLPHRVLMQTKHKVLDR